MASEREQEELLSYLDQIIEATRSGAMEWSRVNPTTFVWSAIGKLTLQMLSQRHVVMVNGRPVPKTSIVHMLQAFDVMGALKVTVNGEVGSEAEKRLAMLYECAVSSHSRKELDFLKSIIPPH